MGVRESNVERYLQERIKEIGGTTRKWVSPGANGVPDRIVLLSREVWFVEVKTVDGQLSPVQRREHGRLKAHGANVITLYGCGDVDRFAEKLRAKHA